MHLLYVFESKDNDFPMFLYNKRSPRLRRPLFCVVILLKIRYTYSFREGSTPSPHRRKAHISPSARHSSYSRGRAAYAPQGHRLYTECMCCRGKRDTRHRVPPLSVQAYGMIGQRYYSL